MNSLFTWQGGQWMWFFCCNLSLICCSWAITSFLRSSWPSEGSDLDKPERLKSTLNSLHHTNRILIVLWLSPKFCSKADPSIQTMMTSKIACLSHYLLRKDAAHSISLKIINSRRQMCLLNLWWMQTVEVSRGHSCRKWSLARPTIKSMKETKDLLALRITRGQELNKTNNSRRPRTKNSKEEFDILIYIVSLL